MSARPKQFAWSYPVALTLNCAPAEVLTLWSELVDVVDDGSICG